MKKSILKFLSEMTPVVMGVLIALLINNWNETRKEKNYVTDVMNSIKHELSETKKDIEIKIPKQEKLLNNLKKHVDDESMSLLQIVEKSDGLYVPLIRTNSWIAFANNKIELMEYQTLSTLNDIEEGKGIFRSKLDYILKYFYSNLNQTSKEKKEQFIIILSDLISTQRQIKSSIETFEKQ